MISGYNNSKIKPNRTKFYKSVLQGIRMIFPKSLREGMKHLLHVGQLGIVKIKGKIRYIKYC